MRDLDDRKKQLPTPASADETRGAESSPRERALLQRKFQSSRAPKVSDLGASQPLEKETKQRMAGAFGQRFDDVKIHTGGAAEKHVEKLGVDAVTVGDHIAFGAGAYQPGAADSERLLAHELGHTLQQRGGDSANARLDALDDDKAPEGDADRMADLALGKAGGAATRGAIEPGMREAPTARGGNCTRGEKKEKKGGDEDGSANGDQADEQGMSLQEVKQFADVLGEMMTAKGVEPGMWAFTGSFALALLAEQQNVPLRDDGEERRLGDLDVVIESVMTTFDTVTDLLEVDADEAFKERDQKVDGQLTRGEKTIDADVVHGEKYGNPKNHTMVGKLPVLAIEQLIKGYEAVIAEMGPLKGDEAQALLAKTKKDLAAAKRILEAQKKTSSSAADQGSMHKGPHQGPHDDDEDLPGLMAQ